MTNLFDPYKVCGITLRNRIGVSPMCEYSADDGMPNDWHLVHLGSRAVGGAGLVMTEATAIEPQGRISPQDTGLWSEAHAEKWARITRFIASQGAVPGIQLAHAGRKASTLRPWDQERGAAAGVPDASGGWEPVGPSALAFDDGYRIPRAMTQSEIGETVRLFAEAAQRSDAAGFDWLELHAAHGYLMHSFLSPLSNTRTDEYGGGFENRIRFTVETTRAVRSVWPQHKPLAIRFSCTDWAEGGWTLEETVELSRRVKAEGVDLVDCSSGGGVPHVHIPVGPGYQVPFAETVRRDAGIATAAVGLITAPAQADQIIRSGQADLVLLARESLRDPYWPLHAARTLGLADKAAVPVQYTRAF
jgi:2,4-dienoyl-CoA reductase-like NADH-dependent reductase (Old Yellow Enzyme family)